MDEIEQQMKEKGIKGDRIAPLIAQTTPANSPMNPVPMNMMNFHLKPIDLGQAYQQDLE